MARIRSVHPELFTDEGFCSLSPHARLLYIGIWTQCDDQGIFEWKPFGMKINLLPVDTVDIPALLLELVAHHQIKKFEVDGKAYGAVRNFCIFQRPKKVRNKYECPAEVALFVAVDRRKAHSEGDEESSEATSTNNKPRLGAAEVPPKAAPRGEKRLHRRGEEGSGSGGESNTDRKKPVVVVVPDVKAEATTTTTVSKNALQGKKAGLGAVIGRPLPPEWVPDDKLCEKVLADFGMTTDDVNAELPTFHALNVQNGTMSQDWNATFYLFAKRWKERAQRAAPRVELNRMPGSEPISSALWKPTEKDWEAEVKRYAATGRWSAQFGPDPESAACRCPPHLLEKHLPNPAAIPVLAKVRA